MAKLSVSVRPTSLAPQHFKQRRLDGVLGTSRVSGRRTNALITFGNQCILITVSLAA